MHKTIPLAASAVLLTAAFAAGCTTNSSHQQAAATTAAAASPSVPASAVTAYGTAAQGLKNDLSVIAGIGPSDYTAMTDACTTLGGDVDQAVNLGPYPNPSAQQLWSKALTDLKAGATECVAGVQNQDASLLSKTGSDLQTAQGELETAMTAMEAQ